MGLSISLPASISLEHTSKLHQIFMHFTMAVVQSSSGGVAICYVLPVLWMTSHFLIIGTMAPCCWRCSDAAAADRAQTRRGYAFTVHTPPQADTFYTHAGSDRNICRILLHDLRIGVNSYWAQGLKPPHFYDHGARLYDEPPTFVT